MSKIGQDFDDAILNAGDDPAQVEDDTSEQVDPIFADPHQTASGLAAAAKLVLTGDGDGVV